MSTTTKSLSALQASARYGISENTARLFVHKLREGMKSSDWKSYVPIAKEFNITQIPSDNGLDTSSKIMD